MANTLHLDSLWQGYAIKPILLKIIVHPKISDQAKLEVDRAIASKLYGTAYFSIKAKQELARIYAKALKATCVNPSLFNIKPSHWGFILGNLPNRSLGSRMTQLGEVVLPKLLPLLDNKCTFKYNSGLLPEQFKLRVKDLAAYIIADIRNINLPLGKYKSPIKRDSLIEGLKQQLKITTYTPSIEDQLIDFLSQKNIKHHLTKSTKDSLWKNYQTSLINIISKPNITDKVKLWADLIIYQHTTDASIFDLNARRILARLYAKALKKTCYDRYWFYSPGFLWADIPRNSPASLQGARIASLGEVAIPMLINLLDDNCIIYDRRYAASHTFRVKDYAAFYIAKIKKISLPLGKYQYITKRDKLIEKLKKQLK